MMYQWRVATYPYFIDKCCVTQHSINMIEKFKHLLENKIVVSESGIHTNEDVKYLYSKGVKAFLVGEALIKQENLKDAVINLLN